MFTLVTERLDEYTLDQHTPICFRLDDGDLLIEIAQVIYGYRVTLREIDSGGLIANWCAGPEYEHILFLLECMAGYVIREIDPPFNSEIKPYFKDHAFKIQIQPFHTKGVVPFTPELYSLLRIIAPVNYTVSDEKESVLG